MADRDYAAIYDGICRVLLNWRRARTFTNRTAAVAGRTKNT
jgi:hypothetical protein